MPISDRLGFDAGTIVVVPFPYSARSEEKRRPAVVVSGERVARAVFVWIAMITSARNSTMSGDLLIEDLELAGLAVASVVRPLKIACIERSRILFAIGSLRPESAQRVFDHVRALIGPP